MSTAATVRAIVLPVLAAGLVSGVLGVQLAHGGGDFTTAKPVPPCTVRKVTSVSTGIDGLTERLVLLGLDRAACHLGVTREGLLLDLAQPRVRTSAQVDALHDGLLQAIRLMKADGTLPQASDLTDEAVDDTSLPGFVKSLIKALPDSVINGALKTDDVLQRTVDNLDLRTLLADLSKPDELNSLIKSAVTKAIKDSLVDRLRDLI